MSSSVAVLRFTGMKTYCLSRSTSACWHVLADLLVELRPRFPGAVLVELARHSRACAGDEQNLLARSGVEIHVDEGLRVDRVRLLLRELLREQKRVGLGDAGERPLLDERLGHGRRHARQRAKRRLGHGVQIGQALADLASSCRAEAPRRAQVRWRRSGWVEMSCRAPRIGKGPAGSGVPVRVEKAE